MSKSKPLTADDVRRAIGKVFQGQLSDSLVDQVVESLGLTPVSFMEELQVLDDALQPGTNRIDAIRKRRAAITDDGRWFFRNETTGERHDGGTYTMDACVCYGDPMDDEYCWELFDRYHIPDLEFCAAAPDDIDYLLAVNSDLERECERWAKDYTETTERLLAEVERLREVLKKIFWMQTCHMENMPEAGCPSCLAGDTLGDVLIEYGKQDLLQQLTDLDQSRYEEADNPLVKYGRELSEGGLLDEFERQTKETDT